MRTLIFLLFSCSAEEIEARVALFRRMLFAKEGIPEKSDWSAMDSTKA